MAGSHNPYLLGILLVAQTRSGTGAQVIFHYPPHPLSDQQKQYQDSDHAALDESSSSDSDSESSSDDNVFDVAPPKLRNHHGQDDRASLNEDDDDKHNKLGKVRSSEKLAPSWEPLLGIGEEGLVSLLAPGRSWHKRKFELGINDLTFVGRPVYARESGSWQKRRRKEYEEDPPPQEESQEQEVSDNETDGEQPQETESKSPLIMFHVVFVMNPPPLEQTQRVKDMYDNVIRKLSKILKWEQTTNDYVWKQTDIMQSIKSVHYQKEISTPIIFNDLLKRSSLATAIATTYRAISTSRVAAVSLSPNVSISLQIPPVTSTGYLPSLNEPSIQPGLWLTTANTSASTPSDLDTDITHPNYTLQLAKSFTLLLQDSPQKILKDIQSTAGPLALPLADFITSLRPTKSFYKISQLTTLPLADIQLLSRHLIYWRRAVAIPPLHHRDIYIVSPNADLSNLTAAAEAFDTTFPMLPSLPRLLGLLSGPPVPYGTLIPSSDHKDEYYRVLAWLVRGGWVTQLRTFGYIRVSPAIKKAVRDHDRREKHDTTRTNLERLDLQATNQGQMPSSKLSSSYQQQQQQQQQPFSAASTPSSSLSRSHPPPEKSPSHTQRPHLPRPPSSSPSTTTATTTNTQTNPTGPPHNPSHASLILSPLRASALETKWLAHIHDSLLNNTDTESEPGFGAVDTSIANMPTTAQGRYPDSHSLNESVMARSASTTTSAESAHLTRTSTMATLRNHPHSSTADAASSSSPPGISSNETQLHHRQRREELHALWPRVIKYFNGTEPLENIAVREGWKRKVAEGLLEGLVAVSTTSTGVNAGSGQTGTHGHHSNGKNDGSRMNEDTMGTGGRSRGMNGGTNGIGRNGHGHGSDDGGLVVYVRHW